MQQIIMESDSKQLVDLWNESLLTRSEVTPILAEIRELSRSFLNFSLCHVKRQCNIVAHLCAKKASSNPSWCMWRDIPNFMREALLRDCNSIQS